MDQSCPVSKLNHALCLLSLHSLIYLIQIFYHILVQKYCSVALRNIVSDYNYYDMHVVGGEVQEAIQGPLHSLNCIRLQLHRNLVQLIHRRQKQGGKGAMAPLKFKTSPQDCSFCNRKSLQFSKVAPLTVSIASSASVKQKIISVQLHCLQLSVARVQTQMLGSQCIAIYGNQL